MTPVTPRAEATLWDRWLVAVLILVLLYGVALVVAGGFVGGEVFDRLGFGPDDGGVPEGEAGDYLRLVFGILGAVIAGWMVIAIALAIGPVRRRETWAWQALVASVALWFVLDTGLSVALGWWTHAWFNVGFGLALSPPLLALRGYATAEGLSEG